MTILRAMEMRADASEYRPAIRFLLYGCGSLGMEDPVGRALNGTQGWALFPSFAPFPVVRRQHD